MECPLCTYEAGRPRGASQGPSQQEPRTGIKASGCRLFRPVRAPQLTVREQLMQADYSSDAEGITYEALLIHF